MGKSRKSRRKARRTPSAGRRRWVVIGVAVGATLIVGLAGFLALAPLRADKPEALGGQQVVVSMAGFTPQRLTAKTGTDLTVTLVNPDSRFHTDGGGWHQFRVEALDLDVKIPPDSQRTVTLRNLRAGAYVFYCDVCCGGKENPSMRGILEVTG